MQCTHKSRSTSPKLADSTQANSPEHAHTLIARLPPSTMDGESPPLTKSPRELKIISDEALIECYRTNLDSRVFAELEGRYHRRLTHYLSHILGNRQLAEDAFQDTMLKVHLKRDTFDTSKSFCSWVYVIAHNSARDVARRLFRRQTISLDQTSVTERDGESTQQSPLKNVLVDHRDESPSRTMERGEFNAALDRALEHLRPGEGAALHLVYFKGQKYREAAKNLGIPVGTVKSRLHHALQRLAKQHDLKSVG